MDQRARIDALQRQLQELQGGSVRATWAKAVAEADGARKPLRRDAPPLPLAIAPTDDQLSLRLAEELDYARRILNAMGDTLAMDGLLIARHGVALQSVDIVGQILGHIATVVRSSDPAGAVDLIGMSELKSRLTRKSVG